MAKDNTRICALCGFWAFGPFIAAVPGHPEAIMHTIRCVVWREDPAQVAAPTIERLPDGTYQKIVQEEPRKRRGAEVQVYPNRILETTVTRHRSGVVVIQQGPDDDQDVIVLSKGTWEKIVHDFPVAAFQSPDDNLVQKTFTTEDLHTAKDWLIERAHERADQRAAAVEALREDDQ